MSIEREISVHKIRKLAELKLPEQLRELSRAQCDALCAEIRALLIGTVLRTGGHLSSNLGVVELTLALHRNFHSPQDRIVWDVGHQAYVHKLLTGRASDFATLRQENGLSGFPKPEESPHDTFITGHSSTAVSAAFGMAEAMRMDGDSTHFAVAVVGDGSMTGGMFYEGLNNAGKSRSNIIVILNDNNCAISKNVGAIAKYLSKIRNSESYVRTKWRVEKAVAKTPVIGDKLVHVLKSKKDQFRRGIVQTTIFDELGFVYLGPVDGHDIDALDEVLTVAKSYGRPVLVHVRTVKGKGYKPAEDNPGEYHGVPKACAEQNGVDQIELASRNPEVSVDECYSTVFGKALTEYAKTDESVCAVTAAMKYGTGLQFFAAAYPNRFYDVGIAEQHAATFCAGLASMRKLPVFAVYSTFSQRAFDQFIHDAAIANYHLVLGIDRAGIVGEDGETHQGIFDIPMLSTIPGCKIYSPASYKEVEACLKLALFEDTGLAAVRYPRGKEPEDCAACNETLLSHSAGRDILLITYGRIGADAEQAAARLNSEGISCGVLRLVTVYPIPEEAVEIAMQYPNAVFFEEGSTEGGIGEKLAAQLLMRGWRGNYRCCGIHGFVPPASVTRCLAALGLDADSMYQSAKALLSDGTA